MPKSKVSGFVHGEGGSLPSCAWLALAALVAACSTSVPSEQVVRRNMPGGGVVGAKAPVDKAAALPAVKAAGTPAAGALDEPAITSQAVEKELNRLEAELGRR